jgi:hypothetical protein
MKQTPGKSAASAPQHHSSQRQSLWTHSSNTTFGDIRSETNCHGAHSQKRTGVCVRRFRERYNPNATDKKVIFATSLLQHVIHLTPEQDQVFRQFMAVTSDT